MAEHVRPFQPPAHIAPYVDVLGEKGAVDFLMRFGGSEVNLSRHPSPRSEVARFLGVTKARELAVALGNMKTRVPIPKPWIATYFFRIEGLSIAEIARRLHVSDEGVRKYHRKFEAKIDVKPDPQLKLPL